MEFEWDETKNASNIAKHGISFQLAVLIFDGPLIEERDERFDYGEDRTHVWACCRVRWSLPLSKQTEMAGRD